MSASFYKNNQLTLYRAKKLSAKKVLKISRMRRECSSWHFANVQKIHLHANHLLKSLRYLIFRYPDSVFKLETDLETDLDFFERRFYSIVGVFTNWILLNSIQNELSEYTDVNFKVHGEPFYIFKNALEQNDCFRPFTYVPMYVPVIYLNHSVVESIWTGQSHNN